MAAEATDEAPAADGRLAEEQATEPPSLAAEPEAPAREAPAAGAGLAEEQATEPPSLTAEPEAPAREAPAAGAGLAEAQATEPPSLAAEPEAPAREAPPAGARLAEAQATEPPSLEAEPEAPAADDSRATLAADIGVIIGVVLVLVGAFALAFVHFAADATAQLAALSVAGGVALAVARASRGLRPRAASNWLAAAGALLLGISIVLGSAQVGYAFASFQEGWVLTCIILMVVCGAVCWWLRSAMAGSLAGAAWVALPGVLALPATFELTSWPYVFTEPMPSLALWGTLSLMVVAVLLVELASMYLDRRSWAGREATVGVVATSSTVLGIALVAAAATQGASWFYFFLIGGAVALTGLSVWRGERTWLSLAGRLFTASALTTLFHIDEGSSMALALLLLGLTFFTFTPLRNRLPGGFAVLRWEAVIWLNGLAIACAFALELGAWPVVEWAWAGGMVALGVLRGRPVAMLVGGLALFIALMVTVIDMLGATVGTGFGTLLFGVTVIGAMIVWRQQIAAFSRRDILRIILRDIPPLRRPRLTLRAGRS